MLVNACRPRHMHLHIFYVCVLVFVCAHFPLPVSLFPSPHFFPSCIVSCVLDPRVLLVGVGSPEITNEKQQQTVG